MDDRKAIESAIYKFIEAYNAADIVGVLAYYGDDLINVRSGAPAEKKPETARRLADVFRMFLPRVEVVTDEIFTSSNFAFSRGSFRVTLSPKAGGESQMIERR